MYLVDVQPHRSQRLERLLKVTRHAPLVFVYTGGSLPAYAEPSLSLSLNWNATKHIVISDASRPGWLPGDVEYLDARQFRPADLQQLVGEDFPYPLEFRNGFWVRTIERFHILNEWSSIAGQGTFVHSELDNLCLGIQGAIDRIDGISGFAVPRESLIQAVASVVLVNTVRHRPFDNLLDFIKSNSRMGNEMEIIAAYLDASANIDGNSLPTISQVSGHPPVDTDKRFPWRALGVADLGGLFDAASVGRWLLGVDPRNRLGMRVLNLEEHPRTTGSTASFMYSVINEHMTLTSVVTGEEFRLYNLHVHSKIFHRLLRPRFSKILVARANKGKKTTISHASREWFFSETKRWARYLFSWAFLFRWARFTLRQIERLRFFRQPG